MLKLIRMWLEAPVVEEDGAMHKPEAGTPHGGVLSPLLANLHLHWFDRTFHGRHGPAAFANAKLVRDADDFVILARYQGPRIAAFVEEKIERRLGLTINRKKTRIVKMNEPGASFTFFGYTFVKRRDRFGRGTFYLSMEPSEKAVKRLKDKLKSLTGPNRCFVPTPELIRSLNRTLRGWAVYFSNGYARAAFRKMNHYVRTRLYSHLNRRSQRRFRPPEGKTLYSHLADFGLVYL